MQIVMLHAARQPRSWLIFDVDLAAYKQAEKSVHWSAAVGCSGLSFHAAGRQQTGTEHITSNACVDAYHGMNRDRADLRGLDTDVSLVRLARNIWALAWARAVKRVLAGNVNVHGPAARSLTTAATAGGVSKNKIRPDGSSGPEPEAKTSSNAVGSDFGQRHLPEEVPDEAGQLTRQRHIHLRLHDAPVQ
jgi:hypothetical protein